MKLSFKNNVIGLSAETDIERDICAMLAAADGHVFRLHCTSARGLALSEIGPEAEACREPLNITRSVETRFAAISNLARTKFEIDGERYASVEGFWQGLKFTDIAHRRKIGGLSGVEAKDAGNPAGQPHTILYAGETIPAGSPEHWALMRKACEAKFTQNAAAREALLATGERWLTHKVRKDSRTIPGVVMANIWMVLRERLRNEGGDA
jgi:predicted NAD-dependent protein-ADP-ribosyltransferase YbiA (DUF1768 family)